MTESPDRPAADTEGVPPPAGPRVLVVDDDPDMQRYIRLCLERGWSRGCVIEVRGDGAEALLLAERERFDVVVTDVRLPGMDGLALAAALGASRAHAGPPVLVVTGEPGDVARAETLARERGDRAVLAKPFNAARLVAALERLLELR